ncbi:MerR family transcriptional regulator [Pseudobacillus badius]|uniref:MerR family transcriptional regulator n=1 Tax=Bacillus badius TaxID=1455 RepID=UPI0007B055D3|nr:MerR family transcriptional regulator [Bacillus badius]KZN98445.1 MarR family transcriptional regulator [Bacillus badius]OCS83146.1 MarR family transcriptional regulator [Bacillus badius]OVE51522.1 MarR family transcriptional regulator [Bacillus badius]TDW02759.1 DNA-binding transcriptional MerR regulator [Bacillus badius]
MRIKEFANKYQLQADTLRYYEKQGLLQPNRRENGYREYDEKCEKQLQLLIVLKQLGFTLKEVQQLITLNDQPVSAECNEAAVELFAQKLRALEEKIQFYQLALNTLQTVKELVSGGKYQENEAVIEEMVLNMFKNSRGRGNNDD